MTTTSVPKTLTVTGLSAGYRDRPVLHALSLPALEVGQLVALVGPNGAGKSTLLRVLAGLLRARGTARFGDHDLLRERGGADEVSFMPQALPQRVGLTVLEGVMSALKATPSRTRVPESRTIEDRALAMLERIGIADLALSSLDRLSGGQRQLASLAQAIVREPTLLLLDEPTSSLDLRHQVVVMHLAQQIAAEGRLVMVVLHDLSLAVRCAAQVIVMNQGRVHACGRPDDAITPRLLADVYGVTARVERCSLGRLQILVDGPEDRDAR
jgi:iron complex transport system ATP-binding protein